MILADVIIWGSFASLVTIAITKVIELIRDIRFENKISKEFKNENWNN